MSLLPDLYFGVSPNKFCHLTLTVYCARIYDAINHSSNYQHNRGFFTFESRHCRQSVRPSVTPGTAACQAPLYSTISQSLLKFMSIESVMLSNHLIFRGPLLLLPSIFPSIRVFSNELALHIPWPKYWSFSNSPSNEYSGLISFRIDWFDLLAVQGTVFDK